MNRKAIADVYADVDNAIRLIYQYFPGADPRAPAPALFMPSILD